MKARSLVLVAVLGASLVASAVAKDTPDTTDQDLVGRWRRDDGRIFRIALDAQSGELVGTLVDPPENSVTHLRYDVALHLRQKDGVLLGRAVWTDQNPRKGQPNQPDTWSADALWAFDIAAPGKLKGKSESFSFGRGKVTDKAWDLHELERLRVRTLGTRGAKAPDTVAAAQPIDAAALDGTWKTSTGREVQFKAADTGYVLALAGSPASGSSQVADDTPFPEVHLVNEANLLHGTASWDNQEQTGVELALTSAGHLEGRTGAVEGEKDYAERGWAAFALEKLAPPAPPPTAPPVVATPTPPPPATEPTPPPVVATPTPPPPATEPTPPPATPPVVATPTPQPAVVATPTPPPAPAVELPPLGPGAPLVALDWKRDDGVFLKLMPAGNGSYTGELVTKAGESRGRIELAPGEDGRLSGKATFILDGVAVDAKWELAPHADGTLDAHCEWLDWNSEKKTVDARGLEARKFKAVRRLG